MPARSNRLFDGKRSISSATNYDGVAGEGLEWSGKVLRGWAIFVGENPGPGVWDFPVMPKLAAVALRDLCTAA